MEYTFYICPLVLRIHFAVLFWAHSFWFLFCTSIFGYGRFFLCIWERRISTVPYLICEELLMKRNNVPFLPTELGVLCAVISVWLLQAQYVSGAFVVTASLWLSNAQWNKKPSAAKPQWELINSISRALKMQATGWLHVLHIFPGDDFDNFLRYLKSVSIKYVGIRV